MERLRDTLRRSDYKAAVREASGVTTARMNDVHLRELFSAMVTAGAMLNDGSDEELLSCELAVKFADRLSKRNAGGSDLDEEVAAAMLKKGITLWRLNRYEPAAAEFDAVARRFKVSGHPTLRLATAVALANKGATLEALGRSDDALTAYETVIFRYSQISDYAPDLFARAVLNRGAVLGKLGRVEEEIAVYDELVRRFGASTDASLQERIVNALFNKAVALADSGQHTEAAAAYDELKARADPVAGSDFSVWLAKAMFNKGVLLATMGKPREEIATYDELVSALGAASGIEQVVKAQINKAICLDGLGKSEEQLELCRDVLRQCESLTSGSRDLLIAKTLLVQARACSRLDRADERTALCQELFSRFAHNSDPDVQACLSIAARLRDGADTAVPRLDATVLFRYSSTQAAD
jgi:tetratricopeptide (TPR) repeat protein